MLCLVASILAYIQSGLHPCCYQHALPSAPIAFSTTFHLLGPFQTGTREATWGADPLEYHGGFHSLHPSPNTTYHSSLAPNGTVKWSTLRASVSLPSSKSTRARLLVQFPDLDWESLKAAYGWAGLQYQAWARGTLTVGGDRERTVVLYTDQVLEFWLDDEHHFGGDFYAYRKAPLVLHLEPGEHIIDVRIVRDVRAMGAVGEPTVNIDLEAEISESGLKAVDGSLLLPDMVAGRLASSLGSISVRNQDRNWIEVVGLQSVNVRICFISFGEVHLFDHTDGHVRIPMMSEHKYFGHSGLPLGRAVH
ncbi:MAG: hypothetical protein Q9211_000870 [Gyalolechia sp. 1 TL-2023]